MKEELKKKMIDVIGSYPNSLIDSIAENCAKVAIDYYKEQEQALNKSSVLGRSEQLFCVCLNNNVTDFDEETGIEFHVECKKRIAK